MANTRNIVCRSPFLEGMDITSKAQPGALLEALFRARNARSPELEPYSLNQLLDPAELKGIDAAVALLEDALRQSQSITVVGDFDADGATSTAVFIRAMTALGHPKLSYLVPNRFEYGYGLTPEIVELAMQDHPELIVTVDNGISSIEGVIKAKELGAKVLVTDHHLPGGELPVADAIVNPNQPGCAFPSKNLAGVGVIFYVMLGLRKKLRESGWFQQQNIAEPNFANLLDLVALGTVSDVVPLDRNNRVLVAQGIRRIRSGHCCQGILAMLNVANRDYRRIVASDFGFGVGPRLNAAGRLDDMSLGIRCLLEDDDRSAMGFALELDNLNKERRSIEASMRAEAVSDLEAEIKAATSAESVSALCVFREDWHQGVVGIVASRIKDIAHRPTIAFAVSDDNELKGSGRSIEGIHLRDVLDEIAAKHPGLLDKFGGHAMAAGLSLERSNLERFDQALKEVVGSHLSPELMSPDIVTDGELLPEQFSVAHAEAIREAGPWGQGFPEPVFHGHFRVIEQKLVGQNHLKLLLCPDDFRETLIDAIAFNIDVEIWPNNACSNVRLVYKLDLNYFRGRCSLQLLVEDLVPLST